MELSKIKENLKKKLNAIRINEESIYLYLQNANYYEENNISSLKILYDFADLVLPEEFLDSIYMIPTTRDEEMIASESAAFVKDILLFLGTEDGVSADYVCPIFPPYLSIEKMDSVMEDIFCESED